MGSVLFLCRGIVATASAVVMFVAGDVIVTPDCSSPEIALIVVAIFVQYSGLLSRVSFPKKTTTQEPLEAVQSVAGDVKCIIIHTGELFGASGGEEVVPFLTGPKAEPVLDESITRQAVLVGPGTVLSAVRDVYV